MSDSAHGHGASLSIGGSTAGNIISISGPNGTREAIKVSTMDSANKYDEFIPGMLDAGDVTVELNYDGTAAGTANMLNSAKTNSAATIIVKMTDGTTTSQCSASGFITSLGHAIPYDGKITQSLGLKLSGAMTFTDEA